MADLYSAMTASAVPILVLAALASCSEERATWIAQDVGASDGAEQDTSGVLVGCLEAAEGAACDDGDPCTVGERCAGGRCQGGDALSCEATGVCEVGRCEPRVGCVTERAADGAACEASCFSAGACDGGRCVGEPGSEVSCPPSADPCVTGLECDPATNTCSVARYAEAGAACDLDADECTLDVCDGGGGCEATGELETCTAENASNPCWTFSCVKKIGCAKANFVAGVSCNDNNACTYNDTCQVSPEGQKTCFGEAVPIDDGNPCTDDSCVAGVVSHTPVDGVVCELPDDLCVGAGICDEGRCAASPIVDCDDGDPCTLDECEPATGQCRHPNAPDGESCDDSDACTGPDLCSGGVCGGAVVTGCCGNLLCEAGEGCACADCEGESCSDENPCTTGDHCEAGSCTGVLSLGCCGNAICESGEGCDCADCAGEACSDDDGCTEGDTCVAGLCVGSPVAGCCGNHVCELGEGCDCADCDGQSCSDENACTAFDRCSGGVCRGSAIANCCGNDICEPTEACDCVDCDGAACVPDGLCMEGGLCSAGLCVGVLQQGCCGNGVCEVGEGCGCVDCEGEACSDGDACTGPDHCVAGQCVGELLGSCCGNDICDAGEGCGCADCEGEACDDGDACTALDICVAGECHGAPVAHCCGNEICEAGEGCGCADCEGQACEAEGLCMGGGLCVGGVCAGQLQADCCGNDVCELGEGCACADCEGEACSDGDSCTSGDTCSAGSCVGVEVPSCCGPSAPCPEGQFCLDGVCNEAGTCPAGAYCPDADAGLCGQVSYGSLYVPPGVTLRCAAGCAEPVEITVAGWAVIAGTLSVDGDPGLEGDSYSVVGRGGVGRCGGASGGDGGAGGTGAGHDGQGPGGGHGSRSYSTDGQAFGNQGGGGSFGTSGGRGCSFYKHTSPGSPGAIYGDAQLSLLQGGSGGGGSGGSHNANTDTNLYCKAHPAECTFGGSGGGAGGGALVIHAGEGIHITATGRVSADGGGISNSSFGPIGYGVTGVGAGGSGGAVRLSAPAVVNDGVVSASPSTDPDPAGYNCSGNRGAGGFGRIRVDTFDGVAPPGTFSPPIGYTGVLPPQ